jgi:hypothetical protein
MGLALERSRADDASVHYQALAESPLATSAVGKLVSRPRGRKPSKRAEP